MGSQNPASDRDDRTIFDTIAETYRAAPEAEQRAMVEAIRHRLPTIPAGEREPLIDAIERAIGENLEWQEPEY